MGNYQTLQSSFTSSYNDYQVNLIEYDTPAHRNQYNHLHNIKLKDLLIDDSPSKFILLDIHDRIKQLIQRYFTKDLQPIMEFIEDLPINICELIFRCSLIDDPQTEKEMYKKYSDIMDNEISFFIEIYGWLLPYYIDYSAFHDDLAELPYPVDNNLRPNSKDGYPHFLPLHTAHNLLCYIDDIFYLNKDNSLIKARQQRQKHYKECHNKLKEIHKNLTPVFKKRQLNSASKQALCIWNEYGYSLGYELETITKKFREFNREK